MTSHDSTNPPDEQQKNLNSLPQWAQDLIRELILPKKVCFSFIVMEVKISLIR